MDDGDDKKLTEAKRKLYLELLVLSHRALTKKEIEIAYILVNDPHVQESFLKVVKK